MCAIIVCIMVYAVIKLDGDNKSIQNLALLGKSGGGGLDKQYTDGGGVTRIQSGWMQGCATLQISCSRERFHGLVLCQYTALICTYVT